MGLPWEHHRGRGRQHRPAAAAGGGRMLAGLVVALAAALAGVGIAPHDDQRPTAAVAARHAGSPGAGSMTERMLTPLAYERENNAYRPRAGDLLPDLTPIAPEEVRIRERKGERQLRFAATWANVGQGPFEMRFDLETGEAQQVVLNADGNRRLVGTAARITHDERGDHDHHHMQNFARYELFEADERGVARTRVRAHEKVSFAIGDIEPGLERIDPEGRRAFRGGDDRQGISPGQADTYSADLSGQAFDIAGLDAGRYVLRLTFDPEDEIAEANEANNVFDVLVELPAAGTDLALAQIGAPRLGGGGSAHEELVIEQDEPEQGPARAAGAHAADGRRGP